MKTGISSILVFFLFLLCLKADPVFLIGTSLSEEQIEVYQMYEDVRSAFQLIGFSVEFVSLPPLRAIYSADTGLIDGDMPRSSTTADKYENLLLVPEPITRAGNYVFSKKYDFVVNGVESLKGYSIGIMRGQHIVKEGTEGLNVEIHDSIQQLFRMLDAERLDLIIIPSIAPEKAAAENDADGIKLLLPAFDKTNDLYLLINIKHEAIIPQLSEAIKALK